MADSWALLRQVVIGAGEIGPAARSLQDRFRLPDGFEDPFIAAAGLVDRTFPIGPDNYLEIVAPANAEAFLHKWLRKVGGAGGYCLSVQAPDVPAIRERAVSQGIRIIYDEKVDGNEIIQLHPSDVGVLLEFDGLADRSRWFWDDITPGPSPDALVERIAAVEVSVPDPAEYAQLWAELAGVPQPDTTSVDFGSVVNFVAGESRQIRAVELAGRLGAEGHAHEQLLGMEFRYV